MTVGVTVDVGVSVAVGVELTVFVGVIVGVKVFVGVDVGVVPKLRLGVGVTVLVGGGVDGKTDDTIDSSEISVDLKVPSNAQTFFVCPGIISDCVMKINSEHS